MSLFFYTQVHRGLSPLLQCLPHFLVISWKISVYWTQVLYYLLPHNKLHVKVNDLEQCIVFFPSFCGSGVWVKLLWVPPVYLGTQGLLWSCSICFQQGFGVIWNLKWGGCASNLTPLFVGRIGLLAGSWPEASAPCWILAGGHPQLLASGTFIRAAHDAVAGCSSEWTSEGDSTQHRSCRLYPNLQVNTQHLCCNLATGSDSQGPAHSQGQGSPQEAEILAVHRGSCPSHCLCSNLDWPFVMYVSLHSSFALCKLASTFILQEHRLKMGLLIPRTVSHVIGEPLWA